MEELCVLQLEKFTWCCFSRVMSGFLVVFLHQVTQLPSITNPTYFWEGAVIIWRLIHLHEVISPAFLQSTAFLVT